VPTDKGSTKKYKKMAKSNMWIWAAVAVVVFLVYQSGALGDIMPSKDTGVADLYPSDLKTTITLNTGDELATSATNANVSYYVFNSAGKYLKEGTTSAGTASFTVPSGGNYKILVYDDDGISPDYLPKELAFSTNGDSPEDRAVSTINVDLLKESNVTIDAVQDPVDLNANISTGAGQTANFDILYSVTTSNAASNKPVIRVEYNSSHIDSVNFPTLSPFDCPDRLTPDSAEEEICFIDNRVLKSADGIQRVSGNLLMDSTRGGDDNVEAVEITIIDVGVYQESNYKTLGYEGFKYGSENPNDNSDVASEDSATGSLYTTGE